MCLFSRNKKQECTHEECKQFNYIMKQSGIESKSNSSVLGKRSDPSSIIGDDIEKSNDRKKMKVPSKSLKLAGNKDADKKSELDQNPSQVNNNSFDFGSHPNMTLNNWMGLCMPNSMFNPYMQMPYMGPQQVNQMQHAPPNQMHPQAFMQRPQSISQEPNGGAVGLKPVEALAQDYQVGILQNELRTQSQAILSMREKIDSIYKLFSFFIKDYQSTKEVPNETDHKFQDLIGKGPNDILSANDLLYYIKGTDTNFEYSLELEEELAQPLVKERNFSLKLKLVYSSKKRIKHANKIMLNVDLYSSDIPPLKIKTNTAGNSVLKGNSDNILYRGVCDINKLQIKEVTSHYRNGWLFLVITPSEKNFNAMIQSNEFVDYKKIKPLIISNVVVKAKMPRQKRQGTKNKNEFDEDIDDDGEEEEDDNKVYEPTEVKQ